MSVTLLVWSGIAAMITLLGLLDNRKLFHYPTAVSMLMLAFMIPQAATIEGQSWFSARETDFAWLYVCTCLIFLTVGFYVGQRPTNKIIAIHRLETLSLPRLRSAALILTAVGALFYLLMVREAATGNYGSSWTGVIALYALLTNLLVFGMSISWLLYLKTKSMTMLGSFIFGLIVYSPVVLYDAKRFPFFILSSICFLGLYFVRGYKPNRALIVFGCLVGAILINKAGDYRQELKEKKSNVAALVYKDLTMSDPDNAIYKDDNRNASSAELHSFVSDINIASYYNIVVMFEGYRDTMIQLYVPAFILGKEFKNSLKTSDKTSLMEDAYPTYGQTRTGFSDSFVSFSYAGVVVFFVMAYLLGWAWRRAENGDSLYQFLYITLLPEALVGITESTSRFIGVLPFVFGVFFVVSRYVTRTKSSRPVVMFARG